MGYYTRFELEVDAAASDAASLKIYYRDCEAGKVFGSYELPLGDDLTDMDSMKWYDWEEDMKNLSKLYPNVLFSLYGEGEEAGDLWKAWFRNGYSHIIKPKLEFPKPADIDEKLPKLGWKDVENFRLKAELEAAENRVDEIKKLLAIRSV